jgi:hypothetical protein
MILQTIETRIILALVLALAGTGIYGAIEHARLADANAKVEAMKPAAKLAEGYRKALKQCEDGQAKVRQQQQDAEAQAQAASARAAAADEAYQKLLANAPQECNAVLDMKLCPAVMDY